MLAPSLNSYSTVDSTIQQLDYVAQDVALNIKISIRSLPIEIPLLVWLIV